MFVDNEVTHIRLVPPSGEAHYGDIRLEPDSWPYTVDHPCRIRRNLTISSAPAHAILDFNFIQVGAAARAPLPCIAAADSPLDRCPPPYLRRANACWSQG